jgi:hypothetical protein
MIARFGIGGVCPQIRPAPLDPRPFDALLHFFCLFCLLPKTELHCGSRAPANLQISPQPARFKPSLPSALTTRTLAWKRRKRPPAPRTRENYLSLIRVFRGFVQSSSSLRVHPCPASHALPAQTYSTTEDRHILNVCHKLRCEAFHRGILRQTILEHISRVLYLTVVELTVKLPFSGLTLPGATLTPEEADFLHRFGIVDATSLVTDDGRRRMADRLRDGVTFDSQSFLSALSDDLVDRIDETIRGLETVGDAMDRARIDRNLQYTQFWREIGASLVERGTREPELEAAYQRWQADSHARYTLRKMDLWRRQADAIRRAHTPALALDSYWGDRQEAPPA